MYLGVELHAPHGGVFVLALPNAVNHLGCYALAILTGTLITTIALLILKPALEENKLGDVASVATR